MNMVTLKAADGHTLDAYRVAPSTPPRGAIVVIQEIFGVNSHIRSLADGFAADGWLAIAPAMFDRVERGIELGYTPADIERGRAIRAKVSNEAALRDMAAAVDAVKSVGKVAVIGYCWGGTLAWLAACKQPGLAAAVSYYGGGVGELLGLKPQCPVMAHFGDKDASIPMTDVEKVKAARKDTTIFVYPAGHGFNCDERGSYDAGCAKQALDRTMSFLAQHIG